MQQLTAGGRSSPPSSVSFADTFPRGGRLRDVISSRSQRYFLSSPFLVNGPGFGRSRAPPLRRILCPLPCQRYRLSSIPAAQGGTHRSRPTEKPHPLPFPRRSLRGHPFSFLSSLKNPPIHYYNNCTHFPFTASGFFAIIFIMYHAIDCAPRGREEGRT